MLLMILDALRHRLSGAFVLQLVKASAGECLVIPHGLLTPLCPLYGHGMVEHLSLLAHVDGAKAYTKVRALCFCAFGMVRESALC